MVKIFSNHYMILLFWYIDNKFYKTDNGIPYLKFSRTSKLIYADFSLSSMQYDTIISEKNSIYVHKHYMASI